MQSINPFSGEIINTYQDFSPGEVNVIIQQVDAAFRQWRLTSFGHRAGKMKNLQSALLQNRETLANLMVAEMGKVQIGRAHV